jgi:hypothetical protein
MATRYVDSAAAGANNGTSKTDAFTTFAAAIAPLCQRATLSSLILHTSSPRTASGATVTLAIPGTAAARSKLVSSELLERCSDAGCRTLHDDGSYPAHHQRSLPRLRYEPVCRQRGGHGCA